ncbi:MAG: Eco57I restriction-modification methylase domain-containing protein [Candidatus Hodarchaeota archaeon]
MDKDDGKKSNSTRGGFDPDLLKELFDLLKIKHTNETFQELIRSLEKSKIFYEKWNGNQSSLQEVLSNLVFERKSQLASGIFYTPGEEVNFMCKYSMLEYLLRKFKDMQQEFIIPLIFGTDKEKETILYEKLHENDIQNIKEAVESVKVLDPSCGSGVFIVGFLEILDELLGTLNLRHDNEGDPLERRINIINRSLFGIDVLSESILATIVHLWSWFTTKDDQGQLSNSLNELMQLEYNFKVGDFLLDNLFSSEKGFDIIIGNPPYIRQEMIAPPGKPEEKITTTEKKEYKEKIGRIIVRSFPLIKKINQKCDYYVYFYFRGLSLLKLDGVLCFITSNSWLDADFGKDLQEFLLKYVPLISIIDSSRRSFEEAEINTIIVTCGAPVLGKRQDNQQWPMLKHLARFIWLNASINEFGTVKNLSGIQNIKTSSRGGKITELACNVVNQEGYRVFPVYQEDLLRDGWKYPENQQVSKQKPFSSGKYRGNKWKGKYLNAHQIFYSVLKKDKGQMVELGNLARIRAGCYSGINDFFYIDDKTISRFNIEEQFCIPIIRSSKDISTLQATSSLNTRVLAVPPVPKSELLRKGYSGVVSYIDWGELQNTRGSQKTREGIPWPRVASVKTRKYWYSIPENNLLNVTLFIQYISNDRFYCPFSTDPILSDRCFHRVFPKENIDEKLLAASLNSTFQAFLVMLLGRSNLGAGALKLETTDVRKLFTLNLDGLPSKSQEGLIDGIERMGKREPQSVFLECGLDPELDLRSQEPNPLPDRNAIDSIIFDELGLTNGERKKVYWSTCESVKRRIMKSRSIK